MKHLEGAIRVVKVSTVQDIFTRNHLSCVQQPVLKKSQMLVDPAAKTALYNLKNLHATFK